MTAPAPAPMAHFSCSTMSSISRVFLSLGSTILRAGNVMSTMVPYVTSRYNNIQRKSDFLQRVQNPLPEAIPTDLLLHFIHQNQHCHVCLRSVIWEEKTQRNQTHGPRLPFFSLNSPAPFYHPQVGLGMTVCMEAGKDRINELGSVSPVQASRVISSLGSVWHILGMVSQFGLRLIELNSSNVISCSILQWLNDVG